MIKRRGGDLPRTTWRNVSKSVGGTAITIRKRSERHSGRGRVPRQPRVGTVEGTREGKERREGGDGEGQCFEG